MSPFESSRFNDVPVNNNLNYVAFILVNGNLMIYILYIIHTSLPKQYETSIKCISDGKGEVTRSGPVG